MEELYKALDKAAQEWAEKLSQIPIEDRPIIEILTDIFMKAAPIDMYHASLMAIDFYNTCKERKH